MEGEIIVPARYKNLPIPQKEGYLFKGWYSAKSGGKKAVNDKRVVKKKDHTLYARWTPVKYTITFNANGGSGKMARKSCKYDKTVKLTKNKFKNPGYKFVEWNTKADGTGTVYLNTEYVMNLLAENGGNIVLYAQWALVE